MGCGDNILKVLMSLSQLDGQEPAYMIRGSEPAYMIGGFDLKSFVLIHLNRFPIIKAS